MIVRKHLDPKIIIRVGWKRVSLLALVSTTVVILHEWLWLNMAVDTLPASILGVAIAFLIGFRVNSAYERWWEARKIWGAITNDSRTLARQALTFLSPVHKNHTDHAAIEAMQRGIIRRQIAFCYALKNSLRKVDVWKETEAYLSSEERAAISDARNVPNAILLLQGKALQEAHEKGYIEDFRHMQMDSKVSALADSMGACERIKNTVFPRQYSYYSTLFVKIYTLLLPFILVANSEWITIPFTIIIGFIFFALDTIAGGIENPFENTINDIPMNAICRNIEINLLQMSGEKNIPDPIEARNGFLF